MICKKCNFENDVDACFCENCGASIEIETPKPKRTVFISIILVLTVIITVLAWNLLKIGLNGEYLESNTLGTVSDSTVATPPHPSEPAMVYVQGGTFTMGCTSEQGNDCYDNEKPAHRVTLSDFYIGKYEVTQAQWQAVMGNNPSSFKGDNLPVENVSWDDAVSFCRELSRMTGKTYRLPTEAEWEYAARGGSKKTDAKYSGSYSPDKVAWYGDNSGNKTHPVGTKQANELGIYDMSGNVWEWCSDWYGSYPASAQTNPAGASEGSDRVARGGSWGDFAEGVRVPSRGDGSPDNRNNFVGFRLACSSR
ncbi:SUMF1/EgtB/PvdO family nonheme iron enzyme [Dysgonomonas termitidis]|uniref:SUMF1/EgtB/PvdO family nonheme iron enzyme n=1 Tax=Dysgonomonas termitidis TaxID=1516126 RepID=A0ABV9L542_9BACT